QPPRAVEHAHRRALLSDRRRGLRRIATVRLEACAGGSGRPGAGLDVGRIGVRARALRRLEVKRCRVDAVALTARPGAVVEDVAEVPTAVATYDLRPVHEEAVVG